MGRSVDYDLAGHAFADLAECVAGKEKALQ